MDEQNGDMKGIPLEDEDELVRRLIESAGPRPPIPNEDLDAIVLAARSAWEAQTRRGSRRPLMFRPAFAMAASLAAVTIGLAFWWSSRSDVLPLSPSARVEAVSGLVYLETNGTEPRAIVKGESIPLGSVISSGGDTPAKGTASLRLLDGASVRIDDGTRLRLVAAGIVELEKGALYADTGPRTKARLEVRTAAGTARDIGTQFAVRLTDGAMQSLRVRVREGAVVVERGGRNYHTPAGFELVLRRDGSSELHEIAGYGPEWEWVMEAGSGFAIEGRTLQEFLDWVARETGWKIRFANEGLADSAKRIVLHGGTGPLRPDQAPFAVLAGAGLEGELQGGTLTVRRSQ